MAEVAEHAAAGTALILCKDSQARRLVIESLQPLAIRSEVCDEVFSATRLLERRKFEAVIVDLQMGEEAVLVMKQLRLSAANRTAVSFAITAGKGVKVPGTPDSTFVLERPLAPAAVCQTLRAAFGLMVRERRRYFRCPIVASAYLRAESEDRETACQTVNVSEGGIAISGPVTIDSWVPAAVRFRLPGQSSQLTAGTAVRWRDKGGLVGLEFQSMTTSQKSELQDWLARKLEETLPEDVARLFRAAGE